MVANLLETIKHVEQKYLRKDIPEFKVGDTIKMKIKVQEADKIRLHPFEGIVIKKSSGKGINASFTVRKISFGEGVERVFPLHSPVIESLNVVSKGAPKRAKLYYLRNRIGKQATEVRAQAASSTPTQAA